MSWSPPIEVPSVPGLRSLTGQKALVVKADVSVGLKSSPCSTGCSKASAE